MLFFYLAILLTLPMNLPDYVMCICFFVPTSPESRTKMKGNRVEMRHNPVFDEACCKCCGPVDFLEEHVRGHVERILKIREATGFPTATAEIIEKVAQRFVDIESEVYSRLCQPTTDADIPKKLHPYQKLSSGTTQNSRKHTSN